MSSIGTFARALVGLALVAALVGCYDDGRQVRDEPDSTPTTTPEYQK